MKRKKLKLLGCVVACVAALGITGVPMQAIAAEGTAEETTSELPAEEEAAEQEDTGEEQEDTSEEETDTGEEEEETTEKEETKTVKQKSQKISVKVAKKVYTSDQFKTSKKTFKIGASAKTKLSYKVSKGSKYVSVNKNGLVTVKRWTPKGNYKIVVTAKATSKYIKATKTITIKVQKPKTAAIEKIKKYISWDLKNNKTVAYSTGYGSYLNGKYSELYKKGSITMSNFKKTKTANGKKYKLTFKLRSVQPTNFSQSEINRIVEFGARTNLWGFWIGDYIVDYQTGENLNKSNAYGVKVKESELTFPEGDNNYKTSYLVWEMYNGFNDPKVSEVTVTVTYPIEYQDLCILAGSTTNTQNVFEQLDEFKAGTLTFQKCSSFYSKKDKQVCHGVRIK